MIINIPIAQGTFIDYLGKIKILIIIFQHHISFPVNIFYHFFRAYPHSTFIRYREIRVFLFLAVVIVFASDSFIHYRVLNKIFPLKYSLSYLLIKFNLNFFNFPTSFLVLRSFLSIEHSADILELANNSIHR